MTRDRTSRPSTSVPNQCSALGGDLMLAQSITSGAGRPRNGAKPASRTTSASQASGTQNSMPSRLRGSLRALRVSAASRLASGRAVSTMGGSAHTHARIEQTVGDVDQEIDEHEAHGDECHAALNHHEITRVDGTDQKTADAGNAEDLLYDDRATHQATDLEAEQSHHRERRRPERVREEDAPVA